MHTTRQGGSPTSSARETIRETIGTLSRTGQHQPEASVRSPASRGKVTGADGAQYNAQWNRLETCARFITSLRRLLATQRLDDTMQRAFFYWIFTDVIWITKDRHDGIDIVSLSLTTAQVNFGPRWFCTREWVLFLSSFSVTISSVYE